MELPVEIRLIIYENLVAALSQPLSDLAILFTNRQVFEEAAPESMVSEAEILRPLEKAQYNAQRQSWKAFYTDAQTVLIYSDPADVRLSKSLSGRPFLAASKKARLKAAECEARLRRAERQFVCLRRRAEELAQDVK